MSLVTSFEISNGSAGLFARSLSRGSDGLIDQLELSLFDENIRGLAVIDGHYHDAFMQLAVWAEGLAERWKGWDGERIYESLNHDLVMKATHSGSHVHIDVALRGSVMPGGWRMLVSLSLDAGEELSSVAGSISTFCRSRAE